MKEYLGWILGVILFFIISTGILFATGSIGNLYKATVVKESVNIDREIFETSKSYVKGMASDLAKYKFEFETTRDEIERNAIRRLILNKFADFDSSKLENLSLEGFLIEMRGY